MGPVVWDVKYSADSPVLEAILTVRRTEEIFSSLGEPNENLFDDRFVRGRLSSDGFDCGNSASWDRHFVRSVETGVRKGSRCEIRIVQPSFATVLRCHGRQRQCGALVRRNERADKSRARGFQPQADAQPLQPRFGSDRLRLPFEIGRACRGLFKGGTCGRSRIQEPGWTRKYRIRAWGDQPMMADQLGSTDSRPAGLCTKNTSRALIERPYSCAPQAVGAVYDRPGFFVQSRLRRISEYQDDPTRSE